MQALIHRAKSEDPWWWPLGPGGVILFVAVILYFATDLWPLSEEGKELVVPVFETAVAVLGVLWILAAVVLRVRHTRHRAPVLVVVDEQGITVDGDLRPWASLSRVEWSPFGLLTEDDGGIRNHIPAQVSDEQAQALQQACDEARGFV